MGAKAAIAKCINGFSHKGMPHLALRTLFVLAFVVCCPIFEGSLAKSLLTGYGHDCLHKPDAS